MYSMKLTESELKCLKLIASNGKASVSEIESELHSLPQQVSRVVRSLVGKGFVRTKKNGLSKTVYLSDSKHANEWRNLILEFNHVPFDQLLSGGALEVLSAISCMKLKSRKEIAEKCTVVSETAIAITLGRLKEVGIVQKKDSLYSVSSRFNTLNNLVSEFRHFLDQTLALDFASDAVVRWSCSNEFIIETKKSKEENGFVLTGPSAFGKFGVPLLVPSYYFFRSPSIRKLRLEDCILHSLFLENRTMLPILLVWKRNQKKLDMNYLREQGEKYGAKQLLDEIAEYFDLEGAARPVGFPPWNEFQLRAKEYEL
jgi:predicted transcriptional regulator